MFKNYTAAAASKAQKGKERYREKSKSSGKSRKIRQKMVQSLRKPV